MQLTVTVRDTDMPLLKEIAERDWRNDPALQASAMLESAIAVERARGDMKARAEAGNPVVRRGRKPASAQNGHVTEVAAPRGRVGVGAGE